MTVSVSVRPRQRLPSALVCVSARQHALDLDGSALLVDLDEHAPVADAESGLGATGEFAQLAAVGVTRERLEGACDALPNWSIEAFHVFVGSPGEGDRPRRFGHASPYFALISSRGMVGTPAASSARTSAIAASSSSVQGSSSSG